MSSKRSLPKEVSARGLTRQKPNDEDGRQPTIKSLNSLADLNMKTVVECSFCHSSKITEVSGSLSHYLDGRLLTMAEANQPGVIHVHDKCLEWAPLVYYEGEIVKGLEKEVSRASKLKCDKCQLKGAALGCYFKYCRKGFHVTCAFETPDCRWDYENYHLLCPSHSSKGLPSDKSRSGKEIQANDPLSVEISNAISEPTYSTKTSSKEHWTAAPHVTNAWVLCGSALSTSEMDLLDTFANLTGANITKQWKQYVTHVIASIDEHDACSRTFKVLMATLSGKWVLNINWIKACMEAGHAVAEEPYEIHIDIHGFADGPKRGRLRATRKAPKLLDGLDFYFSGYFNYLSKNCYEDLVRAAGGTVFSKTDFLIAQDAHVRDSTLTAYVVYNADPPQESCGWREVAKVLSNRKEEAEIVAAKTGARVVDHRWLVDAIATFSLDPKQMFDSVP